MKTQSQDVEEAMATDSREAIAQGDKMKKSIKSKMLRGSTKFWQKWYDLVKNKHSWMCHRDNVQFSIMEKKL